LTMAKNQKKSPEPNSRPRAPANGEWKEAKVNNGRWERKIKPKKESKKLTEDFSPGTG